MSDFGECGVLRHFVRDAERGVRRQRVSGERILCSGDRQPFDGAAVGDEPEEVEAVLRTPGGDAERTGRLQEDPVLPVFEPQFAHTRVFDILRQHAEVAHRVVEPAAEAAEDMDALKAFGDREVDGRFAVGHVLDRRQDDEAGGRRPLRLGGRRAGVVVADEVDRYIAQQVKGFRHLQASVRADDRVVCGEIDRQLFRAVDARRYDQTRFDCLVHGMLLKRKAAKRAGGFPCMLLRYPFSSSASEWPSSGGTGPRWLSQRPEGRGP